MLSKRERVIFYATGGVIIFALVFNFLISPILKKNDALNKEIAVTRRKLKKYMQLLSQKDYIQDKFNKFSATLNVSAQQEDALMSALSNIENLAKNANVRIIDIRPQSTAKAGSPYKEMLIDLRTEGEIGGYIKFIYDLENSLSLLKIERFQLTSKSNSQFLEGIFSISQISISE
jgi:hypothetical protein